MWLGQFGTESYGHVIARKLKKTLTKFELEHLLHDGLIVDLGCGIGTVTAGLKREFPDIQVIGIDRDPEYLERANNMSRGEIQFIRGDIGNLPIKENSIPIAYSNLIYDFYNERTCAEIAGEVSRILKPGGIYHASEVGIENYKDSFTRQGLLMLEEDTWYITFRKPV